MIRKLVKHAGLRGSMDYLFEEEFHEGHHQAHVIAGWVAPAVLEPGARVARDGRTVRDTSELVALLRAPVETAKRAPAKPVWHLSLRNAEGDRVLSDAEWAAVAEDVMHRTGIAPRGDPSACRWVAVRHAPDHIHIVATTVREDGSNARCSHDFARVDEAAAHWERTYGLTGTAQADRTAPVRPTRGEREKAAREGREETPRDTIRREVTSAAAVATGPEDYAARLAERGVTVHLRHSPETGEVTGASYSIEGHETAEGEPVQYSAKKLATDLTWPRLAARWTPEPAPDGLSAPVEMTPERVELVDRVREALTGAASVEDLAERAEALGVTVRPVVAPDGATLAGVKVAGPDTGRAVALHRLAPDLGGLALDEAFAVERERRGLAEVVGRVADDTHGPAEWAAELDELGVKVRYRTDRETGHRIGYSVSLDGERWHAGSRLDPGLSWGGLHRGWHDPDDVVTVRERLRAVAADAWTVEELTTRAETAGLDLVLRRDEAGQVVGLAASATVLEVDGTERQTGRFSAGLGRDLSWWSIERQMRDNREGVPSVEERAAIYEAVAEAIDRAEQHLRRHPDSPAAADIAAATSDALHGLAAQVVGPQARAIRDAADSYARARMEPNGARPERDRRAEEIREAIRAAAQAGRLQLQRDDGGVDGVEVVERTSALVEAVAEVRAGQGRDAQAAAAEVSAALLRETAWSADPDVSAEVKDQAVRLAVEADPVPTVETEPDVPVWLPPLGPEDGPRLRP